MIVATENYRADSDAVGRFIDEMCFLSPAVYATTGELFTAWKRWAAAEGLPEIGPGVFGKALDEHGYPQGARTGGAVSGGGWPSGRRRSHDNFDTSPCCALTRAGTK